MRRSGEAAAPCAPFREPADHRSPVYTAWRLSVKTRMPLRECVVLETGQPCPQSLSRTPLSLYLAAPSRGIPIGAQIGNASSGTGLRGFPCSLPFLGGQIAAMRAQDRVGARPPGQAVWSFCQAQANRHPTQYEAGDDAA